MKIPFSKKELVVRKKKPWRPTDTEIKKSIFKTTDEIREISWRISSWITRAYSAGEKAGEEGGETDKMKLILIGAVGFMSGLMVAMSGLVPSIAG